MQQLEINRATRNDISAIIAVQRRAFSAEAKLYGAHIVPMIETEAELADVFDRIAVLKGCIDGKLVASVRARLDEKNVCQIGRLSVDPDFQNRGFAKAMMRAAAAVYPDCAACELFTGAKSEKNLHLYASLGYRRCEPITPSCDCGANLVFLRVEHPNAR
jgi:ribosomal protein S18 acetylase RimI-like enzyme